MSATAPRPDTSRRLYYDDSYTTRFAARVSNRGEHEGRPFLVMEHLDGDSLAQQLTGRPLPPARAVELAIIISMSLYSPVLATYRLEHTPRHRVARTLSAWSIGQQASIAICTALGGLLAGLTSPRTAITVAGLLILATPLLLPRRPRPAPAADRELAPPGLPAAPDPS